MIIPTEEQVIDRWDALPMNLKEALTSDANSDFVWKIAEAEHVPDQKIYEIGRAVSHVLYGFIHPEDLAAELKDGSQINVQAVTSIASQLNQKIFAPLQQDINRAYQPLSKSVGGPKILQEVKRPEPMATPIASASKAPSAPVLPTSPAAPQPVGQVTSQTAPGFNVNAAPLASNKNFVAAAPAPQAPPPSSDKGWSKGITQNPVVKLGVISPGTPSPAPISPKPATPQQSGTGQQPAAKGISEFERLDMMKKGSAPQTPATSQASPTKPPEPAPVMLHEVSKSAQQASPNFRFDQTAQNQINSAVPQKAAPAKAAVIEFASAPTTTPPVHYSDYKPTMPPSIPANGTPRQVTEIMPPKQQVTAPPPAPPTPPVAPASQPTDQQKKDKVIVQNFL